MKNWTPKRAATAAHTRIARIDKLVLEIADLYGDVFQPVVTSCDMVRRELDHIRETVAEAEEAGATL